jgi:gas vesicle protein
MHEGASKWQRQTKRGVIMREGKYEHSEQGGVATAITFLLIGLGAGTLIGLLCAPKSGKSLRKDIRRRYEDARENLEDWAGDLKEDVKEAAQGAVERGSELADEVRERVSPLIRDIRR